MIHHLPTVLAAWKVGALLLWSTLTTTIAVTEAFLGQMLIALVVALIGATPPTLAIIMLSRKQSAERKLAQETLLASQVSMKHDLDGKLDRLSRAETSLAKAEGVVEGTEKERVRLAMEPDRIAPALPPEIKIVNKGDEPVPTTSKSSP